MRSNETKTDLWKTVNTSFVTIDEFKEKINCVRRKMNKYFFFRNHAVPSILYIHYNLVDRYLSPEQQVFVILNAVVSSKSNKVFAY